MKILFILMTAFLVQVSASTYAQKITLKEREASLTSIFEKINRQSGIDFLVSNNVLDIAKLVSIDVRNEELGTVLDKIFEGQPLDYEVKDKAVIVRKRKPSFLDRVIDRLAAIDVRGTVVDSSGQVLSGATIKVKNIKQQTYTNRNGEFYLENVEEGVALEISYVGYITQTLNAMANMGTIVMRVLPSDLNEVVINAGYYTVKEREKTGNIARVTSRDIENQPVTSPLMALQGRMAGVDITPINGVAGSAVKIQIRGQNSLRLDGGFPFFIVNGVPINSEPVRSASGSLLGIGIDPLSSIDPTNIESIEVLKDADATAIYGSRGANGVVIITTKRPVSGEGTSVEIGGYQGVGTMTNRLDLMNTNQYLEMRREAFKNDGIQPYPNSYDINNEWDTLRSTSWQDELLGGNALITDIHGRFVGSGKSTFIELGGSYHNEGVIFPGNFGFRRINGNLGIGHTSENKKMQIGASAIYGSTISNIFDDNNFLDLALTLPPTAPRLYDDNGDLNWQLVPGVFGDRNSWINPLSALRKTHNSQVGNLIANGQISYDIISGIKLKANLGFTDLTGNDASISPINAMSPTSINSFTTANSAFSNNRRTTWLVEPQVILNKKKGLSEFGATIGSSIQFSNTESQIIYGYGYTSDVLLGSVAAAPTKFYNDNNAQYRYIAGFVRLNYGFNSKYLVNLTARRDGSSRFGPGKQFGNFGAVGLAWIFSDERFLNKSTVISFGKLRASYGTTGSDQVGDYQFLNNYSVNTYTFQNVLGLNPTSLFNPNFAWEINRKLEIAAELKFFENRISLEASWYRNRSSNQLIDYPLPLVTGFPSVKANFDAEVENSGLEALVSSEILRGRKVSWVASFNFSMPKNRLVKFDGIEESSYATWYKVGEPLSIQRLYTWKGVNPQTGYDEIEDIDNDGSIGDGDIRLMLPLGRQFYGGISNAINYAGFDLSFLFQFSKSRESGFLPILSPGFGYKNQPISVLKRWQNPGDITDQSKFSTNYNNTYSNQLIYSDRNTRNVFFARLKTLTFSYRIPKHVFDKFKIEGLNVFLQGQNLLTFTDYKNVLDPETGNSMPPLGIISFGFKVKL